MADKELATINTGGGLTGIQLGDVTGEKKVLTQDEIDAKIAPLSAPESIAYNPQAIPPTHAEGVSYYDEPKHSLSYYTDIPGVTINTAVEQVIRGINRTGATIINGAPVRYAGIDGATDLPSIVPSQADTFDNAHVGGIVTHDVLDDAECWITVLGLIGDVNIVAVMESGQTMVPGARVYLSATEAGKITNVAPDIAVPLGAFFNGIQGSEPGEFFCRTYGIQNFPDITGFLQGQNTPVYSSTTTPQNIVDYTTSGNVVLPVNPTIGVISTEGLGVYDFNFAGSFSFTDDNNTRSIYITLYDVTNATEKFHYTIAIPKDSTEVGGSFSFPVDVPNALDYVMQISSSENMDITLEAVSFSITSKHIR